MLTNNGCFFWIAINLNQSSLISVWNVDLRVMSCQECISISIIWHLLPLDSETALYPIYTVLRACCPVCQFVVNMTPLQNSITTLNQNFCAHCAVPKDQDDRYPIENIKHTCQTVIVHRCFDHLYHWFESHHPHPSCSAPHHHSFPSSQPQTMHFVFCSLVPLF